MVDDLMDGLEEMAKLDSEIKHDKSNENIDSKLIEG